MHKKTFCLLILAMLIFAVPTVGAEKETDKETGLIISPGFKQVKDTCTVCHSPKLITQNRADRDGWTEMIRWMQSKQGLQQLDPALEKTILDYLATNYSPTAASRRAPLHVEFND